MHEEDLLRDYWSRIGHRAARETLELYGYKGRNGFFAVLAVLCFSAVLTSLIAPDYTASAWIAFGAFLAAVVAAMFFTWLCKLVAVPAAEDRELQNRLEVLEEKPSPLPDGHVTIRWAIDHLIARRGGKHVDPTSQYAVEIASRLILELASAGELEIWGRRPTESTREPVPAGDWGSTWFDLEDLCTRSGSSGRTFRRTDVRDYQPYVDLSMERSALDLCRYPEEKNGDGSTAEGS